MFVGVALRVLVGCLGLVAFGLVVGCGEEARGDVPHEPQPQPAVELTPPPNYTGPIDPEWPPSRPTSMSVALEASRLYRSALREGKVPQKAAYQHEGQGLFVEEGQVGDFHYVEVILGKNPHPDHPMPLIVIFHGRGGKPSIPDGPYETDVPLRLLLPRGPDRLGSGYNWLATWTNAGKEELLARSLAARADQLAPAIRAFRAMRPTLGKPILVGFSQGGILSFALATRYPREFAAAFPLAGWLPPSLYPEPGRGQKFPYIYAQHGALDTTVPTQRGRETVQALRQRGLRVDYREVPGVGHIVTPGMDREVRVALQRFVGGYFGGAWEEPRAARRRSLPGPARSSRTPSKAAPTPPAPRAPSSKAPSAQISPDAAR